MRRVMHMIREEAQQESAEAAEQAGHDHRLDHDDEHDLEHDHAPAQHSTQQQAGGRKAGGTGTGQGLLSRALRPPVLANRALSLHNLLDQSAVPELRPHLGTAAAAAVAAANHQVRHLECSLALLQPTAHFPSGPDGYRSAPPLAAHDLSTQLCNQCFTTVDAQAASDAGDSVTDGMPKGKSRPASWGRKSEVLEQVRSGSPRKQRR